MLKTLDIRMFLRDSQHRIHNLLGREGLIPVGTLSDFILPPGL